MNRARTAVLWIFAAAVLALEVSAQTSPAGPNAEVSVASDTTSEMSWAGRLIRLHSALAEIEAGRTDNDVGRLVLGAFADAQFLARRDGMLENATFREMYADVHRLYELHHVVVAPMALSRRELTSLREVSFASLASVDPTLLLGVDLRQPLGEPERTEETAIPTMLTVPASAERLVSAQQQRMMRQYSGLVGMQHAGRSYFPMITRALQTRGVPDVLKYVAVIESSLDPNAESEAGAIGLWQFMPATGAMYGLSEEDLRSPSRSTTAAVHHLHRLGVMFNGDWQLALAAYNGGDGRVLDAVNRVRGTLGRQPSFWEIYRYLPAETREYVAKFIATARVMGG